MINFEVKEMEMKIKERIKSELPITGRRYLEIVYDELGINSRLIDEVFRDENLDDINYYIDKNGEFRTFTSQWIMLVDCIGQMEIENNKEVEE